MTSLRKLCSTFQHLRRAWHKRMPIFFTVLSLSWEGRLRISRLNAFAGLAGTELLQIPDGGRIAVPRAGHPSRPNATKNLRSARISAFEVENVVFEPQAEILRQAKKFFRQPLNRSFGRNLDGENFYTASSMIVWNSSRYCMTEENRAKPLPTVAGGILLNGQSPNNWYHWLINILPKAFIAEKFLDVPPEIPYLVSKSLEGTRMEEALRLLIGNEREILFLADTPHMVKKAIVVETPAREVYRPKNILSPINWSDLGDFHFDIMAQYRSRLKDLALAGRSAVSLGRGRKIFLTRNNISRPFNQSEVESILHGFGFQSVSLEELSFTEQVATMASARLVAGATGAQWAGWLFSERAIGIIFVPRFLAGSTLFAKLGLAGLSELFEFPLESASMAWGQYNTTTGTSRIDTKELELFLRIHIGSLEEEECGAT